MPFPRPQVDLRSPPSDFDERIDWLERWSYGLVLLEEYPLPEIRAAIEAVEAGVREHREAAARWLAEFEATDEDTARGVQVVVHDHEWLDVSLEQLGWFYRIVETEDHGGHRQALGQYGRVLAEALRRHRRDERWLEGRRDAPSDEGGVPRSGKP